MAAVLEAVGEISPPLSFYELPVNNERENIVENVRINAARGLPELQQGEWTDKPLIIVGGGPSLHDYLPILKGFRPDCHVLAVNGAYKFLRSQGVDPEHFLLIDSRPENVIHVDSPHEGTNHCLASQVHPRVFDALRDHDITLFHLGTEAAYEALKGTGEHTFSSGPIGMASVHAIYIAAALGYKTLYLFGYDFSHKAGEAYAFDQPMNKDDGSLEVTLNGQTFITTLALARTAEQFAKAIFPIVKACELDVRFFSEGLLPEIIKASNVPHSEETERRKYEQMWAVDAYRKVSPGLESVEEAMRALQLNLICPNQPISIADFGCGTGRCVKAFSTMGYEAVGVDIASNALEEAVPFVQAALWDADKLPKVDYGFSVDVLEHIPTEKVKDTLKAMAGACRVGCYLNIDTIPDAFGVVIGKTLHLTVQPAQWWERELKEVWREVRLVSDDGRQAIFVCKH